MPRRQLLTRAEWNVMECLWEKSPRTGRDATEYLKEHADWSRSTSLTMLRRMSEKGYVSCESPEGIKVYAPLIPREQAVERETEDVLRRVYYGDIAQWMTTILRQKPLSAEERNQLIALLNDTENA